MPKQQGPYKVVEIRDGVTATLQSMENKHDVLERHISHLVPFHGNTNF